MYEIEVVKREVISQHIIALHDISVIWYVLDSIVYTS